VRRTFPTLPSLCEDGLARKLAYVERGFGYPFTLLRAISLDDLRTDKIVQCWGGLPVHRREWFIWGPKDPFRFYKFETTLPLFPTAGFFLLTTLVALIALAIRALQLQLRRRKGLCVQCGYNVLGNTSGVCPECGNNVGIAYGSG